MSVECAQYILGFVKISSREMEVGETHHLSVGYNPEAAQLGYDFTGQAWATSLTVTSPDSISLNTYDYNNGAMEPDGAINSAMPYRQLTREGINREKIEADKSCLGSLIGYRRRYNWKSGL